MLQVRVASQLPATTGRLHQHPSREPEGGVIAEAIEEALVVIGRELDVAVQLPHVGEAGGQAHPVVEGARLRGVMEPVGSGSERRRGRLDDSHKRNVLHRPPQQIKGAVLGSIVDHDPFVGWPSLRLHAAHDGFDMPRLVEDWAKRWSGALRSCHPINASCGGRSSITPESRIANDSTGQAAPGASRQPNPSSAFLSKVPTGSQRS